MMATSVYAPIEVHAQQVANLHCQGQFYGYPSEIRGRRVYAPYNALGDGQVQFDGQIRNQVGIGRMVYEGYTATAPFEGLVYNADIRIGIAVLDATGANGEQMIIYDSKPTLGPPTVLGEFICRWG
ncbi:MAG: hypothetical protein ACFB3T_00360 [Geminicoccaceae bacterium]